jgi:hypothetical protein
MSNDVAPKSDGDSQHETDTEANMNPKPELSSSRASRYVRDNSETALCSPTRPSPSEARAGES